MLQRVGWASVCSTAAMIAVAALTSGQMVRPETETKPDGRMGGGVLFEFDRTALTALGLDLIVHGDADNEEPSLRLSSAIQSTSTLDAESVGGVVNDLSTARIDTRGAVLLTDGRRRAAFGNFTITKGADGSWTVRDGLNENPPGRVVFELSAVTIDAPTGRQEARLAGELTIARSLADEWDLAPASDRVIGRVLITAQPVGVEVARLESAQADLSRAEEVETPATTIGPDVIVGNLHQVAGYGSSGGISAFSVGTVSCNIGDFWLNWFSNTNQHPVIGQSAFRLKNDRFEQIGQSWLKHGFYALSEGLCFSNCQATNGQHLGVHCSDPYTASLNGQQGILGPKYQVDAHTGYFPYPFASPPYSGILARRLQVRNSDLDPSLNGGGVYFVEGHYVSPDDASAGNQNNNASYRRVTVSGSGSSWTISLAATTQREQPAIRAWQDTDSTVTETDVQVPGEGLFIVAAKATDLGDGYWHYDYAVQNLNSHRSAKGFSVPVDPAGKFRNIGFHDVDYHSGETWLGTDWSSIVTNGSITWTTVDYSVNQFANALRWGTLYNFRFDANRAPQTTDAILTLFRPGTPTEVTASTIGPSTAPPDCNENGISDLQDIVNGTSQDCNNNGIPDECESFTPSALQVATGLTQPVYVTSPPDDFDRLFIVERGGRIKILSGGSVLPTPFLDISGRVNDNGSEQGLLSIAFDPAYATNGLFFVDYTKSNWDTVIARFTVTADPDVADPNSELILKAIPHQDAANHNGGQLQFGPDGYLYAAIGDGGGANDPPNRSQNTGTLLGKMLRLDVNNPPDYIPSGNPYVGAGPPLDEIWAIGFRNPWRFSFDRATGDLYIADVGQASWEEIDFQPASSLGGENYGWRCMEGTNCTGLSGCTCNSPALTLPIAEYSHASGDCSVTGGFVYRGCALPNLLGTYFYADFCSGAIRSFRYSGGAVTDQQDRTAQLTPAQGPLDSISSFGEDAAGELYIVSLAGSVYKIVPQEPTGPVCGNGLVEAGEQCDDGNTMPDDGCSETCQAESAPPNDHCADALTIGNGAFAFNTSGADTDGPDEAALCNVGPLPVGSDIWYCYTSPCTGTVTVSLCDSSYDTMLAVYDGCTCPATPSAMDCDDDTCDLQSSISFQATACDQYLIRVGGYQAGQGLGSLTVDCQPDPIVNDCNANGVDDFTDIACGTKADINGNGVPDNCEITGDYIRGGRLYDRWWSAIAAPEPTTDHPLWPYRPDQTSNTATGSATWRCTECHAWDYKGVDGEYAAGAHRTGFPGVFGTSLAPAPLFDLLHEPPNNGGGAGVPNGHDYGGVLANEQINDLVAFVLSGVIDTDVYVQGGAFLGDPAAGETHYTMGGTLSQCISCHGADGAAINFGTPQSPEYLGTVAVNEPFHFLHRARMGFPGTPMLGWLANNGTNQGAADIGRYAQVNFPVECIDDSQCDDGVACTDDDCDANGRCSNAANDAQCADDGVFCNGVETCDDELGCVEYGNPCLTPGACNEDAMSCGCDMPGALAAGPRYLAIRPQTYSGSIPIRLLVTPNCPQGVGKYLGPPSGAYNVAFPLSDPDDAAILTPAQWGETVYVTGLDIVPGVEYEVQADCGATGHPVLTGAAVAETPVWGDVIGWLPGGGRTGPDGVVDAIDIVAVVDAFKSVAGALPMYAVDLHGCIPNQSIDGSDIVRDVDAFKGFPYPHSACSSPCG